MTKQSRYSYRTDAWTGTEDQQLVNTVMSFASQRKPLLRAFEHFSEQSHNDHTRKFRTPGAVSFRWNKCLSPTYYRKLQKVRYNARNGNEVEYVPVETVPKNQEQEPEQSPVPKEITAFTRQELWFLYRYTSTQLDKIKQLRGVSGTISDNEVLLYAVNTKLSKLLEIQRQYKSK